MVLDGGLGALPAVSVIIPAYNAALFINKAIDSVLRQTFTDYELIVVDDGSVDGTAEVIQAYGSKVRYVHQKNGGVSSARNKGIHHAKAPFIAFLDADDYWHAQKLEKQYAFMTRNPHFALSYTDMEHHAEGKVIYPSYLHSGRYSHLGSGRLYRNLMYETFIFVPTVMVKTECFNTVGLFDESLSNAEDKDMWLRIADKFEIGFLDEALTVRVETGTGATSDVLDFLKGQITLFERILDNSRDYERISIAHKRLSVLYWHLGYHCFTSSNMSGCRNCMKTAHKFGYGFWPTMKYWGLSFLPERVLSRLRGKD
ncbi:glycosyltransferase family 2 protein [Oleidesulfovibrio sp.]|uniref:glycosyltransferase family 2 protein n=1 Tax=Oleidesulfovibrio sp. TaxID=2909707 RepID=UPI003A83A970